MKRLLGVLTLATALFSFSTHSAFAFIGDFDPRFSKHPFITWTVNGKEYRAVMFDVETPTTQSTDDVGNILTRHTIRRVRNDGAIFLSEEVLRNGELVAQFSSSETIVSRYYKDENESIVAIERTALTRDFAITPTFELCDPSAKSLCYRIERMQMLLSVTRDKKGIITGGSMRTVWTTVEKEEFVKKQDLIVTYPDENTLRVIFGGHGEQWAHPDAWHEYRVEKNGWVNWEICRKNFPGECPALN